MPAGHFIFKIRATLMPLPPPYLQQLNRQLLLASIFAQSLNSVLELLFISFSDPQALHCLIAGASHVWLYVPDASVIV